MYTYLLINCFTIIIPLLFSFEPRVQYYKKWKCLFSAIGLTGFVFIIWDHYFTSQGIWGFNGKYLIGINFFKLPLEEILFFFCIPFSCLFIYEIVLYFRKENITQEAVRILTKCAIFILIFLGIWNLPKAYTSTTFFALAVLLILHIYIIRSKYLSSFFFMYGISIIPFLGVNGLLTNGLRFIDPGPVVWYNNAENLSLRIIGIPVEDFVYSMLLLLLNTTFYEYFKTR